MRLTYVLAAILLGACVPTQSLCERPWEEYWAGECRPQQEDRDAAQPGVTESGAPEPDRTPTGAGSEPPNDDWDDDDDDDYDHDEDDEDDDDDDRDEDDD